MVSIGSEGGMSAAELTFETPWEGVRLVVLVLDDRERDTAYLPFEYTRVGIILATTVGICLFLNIAAHTAGMSSNGSS